MTSLLFGFSLGLIAAPSLRAQSKAPVYYIAEIDVIDPDAYERDYDPKAQSITKAAGGRILASGGNVYMIEGQRARTRVVVQAWESMEKIQAWLNSAEFKEASKIGNSYARVRAFAVEGLPQ
jgi:uncharacterized protein (DUF1330 family)